MMKYDSFKMKKTSILKVKILNQIYFSNIQGGNLALTPARAALARRPTHNKGGRGNNDDNDNYNCESAHFQPFLQGSPERAIIMPIAHATKNPTSTISILI